MYHTRFFSLFLFVGIKKKKKSISSLHKGGIMVSRTEQRSSLLGCTAAVVPSEAEGAQRGGGSLVCSSKGCENKRPYLIFHRWLVEQATSKVWCAFVGLWYWEDATDMGCIIMLFMILSKEEFILLSNNTGVLCGLFSFFCAWLK